MEWVSQARGQGRRDDLVLSSCLDKTCLVHGLEIAVWGLALVSFDLSINSPWLPACLVCWERFLRCGECLSPGVLASELQFGLVPCPYNKLARWWRRPLASRHRNPRILLSWQAAAGASRRRNPRLLLSWQAAAGAGWPEC